MPCNRKVFDINLDKSNKKPIIFILICLVITSVLLTAGITYGRYYTRIRNDIGFHTYNINDIRIYGRTVFAQRNEGDWNPVPSTWTERNGRMLLDFSVANGESSRRFADSDTSVRIRVTATEGFDSASCTIYLVAFSGADTQDSLTYGGIPVAITEQSPLYSDIGRGSLYRFYNETGEEMSFSLTGGELSVLDFSISVGGGTSDLSLLQISLFPVIN